MIEISTTDARRLFLHRQGLLGRQPFGRGKGAAHAVIERLGYVQLDTISVLDRAHHHVLKDRVPNYTETMLDTLQAKDRSVFEYWAHAAAILPIGDYRFYRPMMVGWRQRGSGDAKIMRRVRDRIRAEGPLQAREFEDPRKARSQGWWDWKPAKVALEHLFLGGELMVTRREGFQKVFDLTERVLPATVDTTLPDHDEWLRFIARRAIGSLGIATLHDVTYARTALRRFTGHAIRRDMIRILADLVAAGEITQIRLAADDWYADPAQLESLPARMSRRRLHFLSPFDNVVINRQRLAALFGFDYQIECYVPEPKRKYGYFCLPILWGDEFIGRLDARADRKKRVLEVKLLQLEPGITITNALAEALRERLDMLTTRNGCETWTLLRCDPKGLTF